MSNTETVLLSKLDLMQLALTNTNIGRTNKSLVQIDTLGYGSFHLNDIADYNSELSIMARSGYGSAGIDSWVLYTTRSKLTINSGRGCLVRYKRKLCEWQNAPTGNTIYDYFALFYDPNSDNQNYTLSHSSEVKGQYAINRYNSGVKYTTDYPYTTTNGVWYSDARTALNTAIVNNYDIVNNMVDADRTYFRTLNEQTLGFTHKYYTNLTNGYGHNITMCGIQYHYNSSEPYAFYPAYTMFPESMPVFEMSNVSGIRAYLETGDDGGKIDPFDPSNPNVQKVTDFKSSFKMFTSKDGDRTKLTTVCYNSQYIEHSDVMEDEYGIYVFQRWAGSDGAYGNWEYLTKATQKTYPTVNHYIRFESTHPYCELFYGFAKVGDDTNTFGFSVRLKSDTSKEYGFKVQSVNCYTDFWHSSTYTATTRTGIDDGYRFTQTTYNKTFDILFKPITFDDLKDIPDTTYENRTDTEDTSTGSTATEVCGHGLGTYKVTQAGFDAINDALWSTDWTQLFKSNTIDPVKCVISCKGIPFAHSGTYTDRVYIANQSISCEAGKCNPVNTYNIGSYTIQAINNNFTDMTMTKVRVYLPYIAWVELPAEEVISRVGRAQVGLSSVTKVLNFKYIVDFVDGSCRCVISVNGTERWFFDGNCGVDIPVTSDNHTSAINNAIKSGVATVMNVGLAVGSAYAGNAMGVASGVTGAIGSLANTIPTYNYSATANTSGYINHSMGNKIVIVVESPNIQMPNGYGHKYGFPCMRNLTLGSLSGYTKCDNVDLSGINGTNYELNYIKSALESGVYL